MTVGSADGPKRKVLSSALWATSQQVVAVAATGATSVILARSLSVTDFGVMSYAMTLGTVGTTVVAAGLSGLAIRELVKREDKQFETLGALVAIRELFALLAFCILIGVAASSGRDLVQDVSTLSLVVLFARAFDATEYYFQARVESSKTAPVRMVIAVFALLLRAAAAVLGADIWTFVVLYVVEAVLVSAGLYIRFKLSSGHLEYSMRTVRRTAELLKDSWILLLSGVAGQINSRGDVIVLQALLGSASVGIYASAARVSEVFYFLPAVFMTAFMPGLMAARQVKHRYTAQLQNLYDLAFWLGALLAVLIWSIGPWLIIVLFGETYQAAGEVLRIHVMALPFVFMAAVYSKWIIMEGFLLASLWRHALGAAVNIGLNLLLIPQFGIVGAAWSSVISYILASFLACFIGKSTRQAGFQMSLALVAPIRRLIISLRGRRNEI